MTITPALLIGAIGIYCGMLLLIAWFTGRKADADAYFIGNRQSAWYLVAFGMLSDSMSGVTFISVPGNVWSQGFGYLQTVAGYFVGYLVIAFILLPLYYRLNLTSIYGYLEQRFHQSAQRTGALFFLVSRLTGSAARLFATAIVIQYFVCDQWGWPFSGTVIIIILLMLVYTIRGGIKTLVFTDAFQSLFLLGGLVLAVVAILRQMPEENLLGLLSASPHTRFFNLEYQSQDYFWKHFISGAFVCIAMTGLDQNMMKKNLSCRSLKEAQKNMLWFSAVLILVNLLFVSLGALLYAYAGKNGISLPLNAIGEVATDKVFPFLALNKLGMIAGMAFVIGLAAATFSSADSVLTSLTTSCYLDLLHLDRREHLSERSKQRMRMMIHLGFAFLLFCTILMFKAFNNQALIKTVLKLAGYTYGPLLALFIAGKFTKLKPHAALLPVVCLLSPALTWILDRNAASLLGGYQVGNEVLLLNALITLFGLWLISEKKLRHQERSS